MPPLLLLDGGLATELEAQGCDLKCDLWSASLLAHNPQAVQDAHEAYFRAGALMATTCSYQASTAGFVAAGFGELDARRLTRLSVRLADNARRAVQNSGAVPLTSSLLVAASVGSYGALLANGAEFTGDYGPGVTLESLAASHRQRVRVLLDASVDDAVGGEPGVQPDLVLFETIPSLLEAQAIAQLCSEWHEQAGGQPLVLPPVWVSFSCRDGATVCHGEPIEACVDALATHHAVQGIGVNCTAPQHVASLVKRIRDRLALHDRALAGGMAEGTTAEGKAACRVVCYPNSGETWVAAERGWRDTTGGSAAPDGWAAMAQAWVAAGADAVGGCCRTTPAHIGALAAALR
ncbi:Homocysteine S-methyltransferase [Entophlyctis helioformis]|nr:Homocysteine S-methyltransferase [Entophlyctis helioformis]